MILDTAENLKFYASHGIGDRYRKALDFLSEKNLEELTPGRYEIDGDSVYANVAAYETVPWEEASYESHKNYTDIQYVIKGNEIMTYASEESLTPSDAYDAAKDVIHFDNSDPGARFLIRDGGYMIFKPGEVHKSKGLVGKSEPIKKIVVKIKEV